LRAWLPFRLHKGLEGMASHKGFTTGVEWGMTSLQNFTIGVEGMSILQGFTIGMVGRSSLQSFTTWVEGMSSLQGFTTGDGRHI
jgi:hypothetical protein